MTTLTANAEATYALPIYSNEKTLRILIASLALGGAEKIVLDWAKAEVSRGYRVELAVLHQVNKEWPVSRGIKVIRRSNGCTVNVFLSLLAQRWLASRGAISTHLIRDPQLNQLWKSGLKTIPVIHNSQQGWCNDPTTWDASNVPSVIACAESVSNQLSAVNPSLHISVIRHQPHVAKESISLVARQQIRDKLKIPKQALLIGMIGAFKAQKNYTRAIGVLAELNKKQPAYLCILGGLLNKECQQELTTFLRAAKAQGVSHLIRLPGFVSPAAPYFAAFDVMLNTSHYEGFSMAVQEALIGGLPTLSTAVDGQTEQAHPLLTTIPASTSAEDLASLLAQHNVREILTAYPSGRTDRLWTLPNYWHQPSGKAIDTLFVTANLNAGGAQRSLLNLTTELHKRHANIAVAVCNPTTHEHFSQKIRDAGVNAFHLDKQRDVYDLTKQLLAVISRHQVKNVCFWNVDPKVKLLLAKFLPAEVCLIDVSPGAYSFEEMQAITEFQQTIGYQESRFFARLDCLVFKHSKDNENILYPIKEVQVIRNGVNEQAQVDVSTDKRFVISGRVAPSKHSKTIIHAFRQVLASHPDASLCFIGQAEPRYQTYLEETLALCEGLPITFMGAQPELSYLREPAAAAIVLGENQGCPNTVLEFLAAGIPVIANDSGGTRELISGGRGGVLLPERVCGEILAKSMIAHLDQPDLGHQLGERGRWFMQHGFAISIMADQYQSLFSLMVARKAKHHPLSSVA
jgi:glycosyltransferase involved in cell wall biosynthesis